MKKLSIIILSFNVESLLLNCLKSIPRHSDWEIIVVDNASSDNSVRLVKKHFPQARLIVNDRNLGFAAGNNVGIKASSGKYVLLLNPDTLVFPGTIETLLSYMESHPEVGAATCRVELPDGSLDYSCHRGFPTPWGALMHLLGLRWLSSYSSSRISEDIHEIDALTGAFALIRREAGNAVHWLDEDYFWNGEDLDFCYKLKKLGWKIMFFPKVKIIHFKGSSAKATKAAKLRWASDSTAVMKLFYQKHLETQYHPLINHLVYLGISFLARIRSVKAAL